MRTLPRIAVALLAATSAVTFAHAHSWVECLDTDRAVVFDNARTFIYGGQAAAGVCRGYQHMYRGRGQGIADAESMVKILKDEYAQPGVAVCRPGGEAATPQYTGVGYGKRIQVWPGQRVFFAYMPNGHVAVDKAARGTLYGVYWTGRPDSQLQHTSELTDDRLVDGVRHDFDDGVCGQTFANRATRERSGRAGDEFPCVGAFALPPGTAPGVYSLVWMWKFWDEANDRREIETVGGKFGGAAYGSCFDVQVLAPIEPPASVVAADHPPADAADELVDSKQPEMHETSASW